jgi:hypothetical protein
MKYFVITIIMGMISLSSIAQSFCHTPALPQPVGENKVGKSSRSVYNSNSHYFLKVYFHVLRASNGTGGVNSSVVQDAFNILNTDFNPHNIFFGWDGDIDPINDSSNYLSPSEGIFSVNNHQDGIDIYIYPTNVADSLSGGFANGFGNGTELYVAGQSGSFSLAATHIISHEMGHILNLYHTHHGTVYETGGDSNQCAELVNGNNSNVCGDYIEDTPADPGLANQFYSFVDNSCNYIFQGHKFDANNDAYSPLTNLIMSYTKPSCMDTFTTKQAERMKAAIDTMCVIHNTIISIFGSSTICPVSTGTYTINSLLSGCTINWNIDNSNFSISPSGNQCLVTYIGTQQYIVANLTAAISRNGLAVDTLTKRIVMHGTDLYAYGEQIEYVSSNGIFPPREFTIPANNGLRTTPERRILEYFADKESLPIDFIEDHTLIGDGSGNRVNPIFDLCGYGITEINGGNRVYLSCTRLDGMDISFSGPYSPTYFNQSENGGYISFEIPYSSSDYYTTLYAHSEGQCHDFCLTFKVIPLPGAASGDDEIWVNLDGSMLYVTFYGVGEYNGNGQYYLPNYTVTISKIPAGTQVYSNSFPGTQSSFSVNTNSWTSGIYSIRIVQGNNIYTKSIYL